MKYLIIGIMQNRAREFYVSQYCIEQLIKRDNRTQVVIYENDSSDETAYVLDRFAKVYPDNVHIVHGHLNPHDYKPFDAYTEDENGRYMTRIQKIAIARNALLNHINNNGYVENCDVVVRIDMDGHFFDIDQLEISAKTLLSKDLDQLLTNDLAGHKNGSNDPNAPGVHYYDRLALRDQHQPYGPEVSGSLNFWGKGGDKYLGKYGSIFDGYRIPQGKLHPVFAAFGGLGIFNPKLIQSHIRYSYKADDILKEWYTHVFKTTEGRDPKPDEITFTQETDFSGPAPVVCEHVVYAAHAWKLGMDKNFIDPELYFLRWNGQLPEDTPQPFPIPQWYFDDYQEYRFEARKIMNKTAAPDDDRIVAIVLGSVLPFVLLGLVYFVVRRYKKKASPKKKTFAVYQWNSDSYAFA